MTINKRRSSSRISTSKKSSLETTSGSNDKQPQQQQRQRSTKKQKRGGNDTTTTTIKKSHWSRPGVQSAHRLVSLPISSPPSSPNLESNLKSWNRALSHYESMIQAKGGTKLYNLDQQRQLLAQQQWKYNNNNNEQSSKTKSMTKDQLLNVIIPWKFGKGKPRNALKPLLQSNTESDVITASTCAFKFAELSITSSNQNDNDSSNQYNIQEAIKSLCQLSGVGPATASAVLSAYCPQSFAFMDDEVIECLYEAKRGYTLKIYMEVNDRCLEIAEQLNEVSSSSSSGDDKSDWTPADVAKALWTVATMSARSDEGGLAKVFRLV